MKKKFRAFGYSEVLLKNYFTDYKNRERCLIKIKFLQHFTVFGSTLKSCNAKRYCTIFYIALTPSCSAISDLMLKNSSQMLYVRMSNMHSLIYYNKNAASEHADL